MATLSDVVEKQQTRIKCKHTKRLIATIDHDGVHVWCVYEKTSELISWEQIDAARSEAKAPEQHHEHGEAC